MSRPVTLEDLARILHRLGDLCCQLDAEEDAPASEPRRKQPRRKRKLRAEDYELARKVMGGVKEEG